ncbi:hypothetical protein RIB2604_03303050 [Aspergillus luchuensis]|uniref:Uncharacterized protein n=1 Tax=Aspergillus kawachii TaxID=1069201 RepID=A0A146FYC5_ASPKA|nr:hypothetical protein RIB2604_03303050 [Aspergillus luchuensis]
MPWLGGWDGLGIPTNHNSTVHHCSEPGLGWVDGTGLGHTN